MIRITALVLFFTAIIMLLQFTLGNVIGVFNQTCTCNPQLEEFSDRLVADDPKKNERVKSTVSGEDFLVDGDETNEEILKCGNAEKKTYTESDHASLSSMNDKSAIQKENVFKNGTISENNSEGKANCDAVSNIHTEPKHSNVMKSLDSEIRSKEWKEVKRSHDNKTYNDNTVTTFAVSGKEVFVMDTVSNNSVISDLVSNTRNDSEEDSDAIKESDYSGNGNIVSRQGRLDTENNDKETLSLLNNESSLRKDEEVQANGTAISKSQDNDMATTSNEESADSNDNAKETDGSEIKYQNCEKVLTSNDNFNASNKNEKKVQNLSLVNNSEVIMNDSDSSEEDNVKKSDINKKVKSHDVCIKESVKSEMGTENNVNFISSNEFQEAQNGCKNSRKKLFLPDNQIVSNKNEYTVNPELSSNNTSCHSELDGNIMIKNVKSDEKNYDNIKHLKISAKNTRLDTPLENYSNYASENQYTKDLRRNNNSMYNNSMESKHTELTNLTAIEGVCLANNNRNSGIEQNTDGHDGNQKEKHEIMFPPDSKFDRSIDALLRQTDYYDPSYTIIKVVKRSLPTLNKNSSASALLRLVDQESRNVGDGESQGLKLLGSIEQGDSLLNSNVGNWQNEPDMNGSEISNDEEGESEKISRRDNEETEQQDEVQPEDSHNGLSDTVAAVHGLFHRRDLIHNTNAFNSYPDSDTSNQDLHPVKNTVKKNTSIDDETSFKVADEIVLSILNAARKDGHTRRELGICRKITSKGIPLALQKKGREQIIENKTNEFLTEIRSCTAALIRKQVEEQACIILPSELQSFLEWLLIPNVVPCVKPDKVQTNFLFNVLDQDGNASSTDTTCATTEMITCATTEMITCATTTQMITSAATTVNTKKMLTETPCVNHRNTPEQVMRETSQKTAVTTDQKKACCNCTKPLDSPLSAAGLAQYIVNGPVSKGGIWSNNPQPYLMIPNAPAKPVLYLMEKPKQYLPQRVFINSGKKRRELQRENQNNCTNSIDTK